MTDCNNPYTQGTTFYSERNPIQVSGSSQQIVSELVAKIESLTAELAAAQALAARALEALKRLRNEIHGVFGLVEPELRTLVGNTNVTVLLDRLQEADAILSDPSAEGAGKWLEEQKAEAAREHLRFLYDWHSVQETEADAVGALESCEYHQQRRAIFKETLNEFEKAVAKQREWKEAPND